MIVATITSHASTAASQGLHSVFLHVRVFFFRVSSLRGHVRSGIDVMHAIMLIIYAEIKQCHIWRYHGRNYCFKKSYSKMNFQFGYSKDAYLRESW